jgi:hypothetical protein
MFYYKKKKTIILNFLLIKKFQKSLKLKIRYLKTK